MRTAHIDILHVLEILPQNLTHACPTVVSRCPGNDVQGASGDFRAQTSSRATSEAILASSRTDAHTALSHLPGLTTSKSICPGMLTTNHFCSSDTLSTCTPLQQQLLRRLHWLVFLSEHVLLTTTSLSCCGVAYHLHDVMQQVIMLRCRVLFARRDAAQ